jgi:hypothetical protein
MAGKYFTGLGFACIVVHSRRLQMLTNALTVMDPRDEVGNDQIDDRGDTKTDGETEQSNLVYSQGHVHVTQTLMIHHSIATVV